ETEAHRRVVSRVSLPHAAGNVRFCHPSILPHFRADRNYRVLWEDQTCSLRRVGPRSLAPSRGGFRIPWREQGSRRQPGVKREQDSPSAILPPEGSLAMRFAT